MTDEIYHPLYELGQIDREIDELNALITAKRAERAELEAALVQTATEMGEGMTGFGYEVRVNKGRTVTSYDAEKIVPHLTMTQRDVVCRVRYEIIAPVFAAMLDAGKLPEGVRDGVTVKPATERWEVRKAKGDK